MARQAGLSTNIVTNGALTLEAVDALGPHLDVYRVDIKGYHPQTYEIWPACLSPKPFGKRRSGAGAVGVCGWRW